MQDKDKTKEQLVNELKKLRQRVAVLEALGSKHKQVDEKLRESEEKYRVLVENSPNLVGIFQEGVLKYVNRAMCEKLGWTFEEMTSPSFNPIEKIIVQKFQALAKENVAKRLKGEYIPPYEIKMKRRNGSEFPVMVQAGAILYDGKSADEVTLVDITEHKWAEEEIQRRSRELSVLYKIQRASTQSLDLEARLNAALEATLKALEIEAGGIYLLEPDGETLLLRVHRGVPDGLLESVQRLKSAESLSGRAMAERKPILIDIANHPAKRLIAPIVKAGFKTLGGTPLLSADKALGALILGMHRPHAFPPEEIELLTAIGQQLGNAVHNAQMHESVQEELVRRKQAEEELKTSFENLQRALEGTVNVLGAVVEIKDPYTAGHEKRVTKLACAIAREMGFSKDRVEGIGIAGRLHDIGKISVPMSILGKPTRLDETEFSLIKSHPGVGYKILQDIGFGWPIAQVILQHHERMDGSGYPSGLVGKKILLEARILAVADVVSAMASRRPWRPAHSMDSILEELTQNRGTLYDPQVVDSCIKLFVKKGFKFKE